MDEHHGLSDDGAGSATERVVTFSESPLGDIKLPKAIYDLVAPSLARRLQRGDGDSCNTRHYGPLRLKTETATTVMQQVRNTGMIANLLQQKGLRVRIRRSFNDQACNTIDRSLPAAINTLLVTINWTGERIRDLAKSFFDIVAFCLACVLVSCDCRRKFDLAAILCGLFPEAPIVFVVASWDEVKYVAAEVERRLSEKVHRAKGLHAKPRRRITIATYTALLSEDLRDAPMFLLTVADPLSERDDGLSPAARSASSVYDTPMQVFVIVGLDIADPVTTSEQESAAELLDLNQVIQALDTALQAIPALLETAGCTCKAAVVQNTVIKQPEIQAAEAWHTGGWTMAGGWTCAIIERETDARSICSAGWSLCDIIVAELQAYLQASMEIEALRGKQLRRRLGRPLKILIVTDNQVVLTQAALALQGSKVGGLTNPIWAAIRQIVQSIGTSLTFRFAARRSTMLNVLVDQVAGRLRRIVTDPKLSQYRGKDGSARTLVSLNPKSRRVLILLTWKDQPNPLIGLVFPEESKKRKTHPYLYGVTQDFSGPKQ